MRIGLYTLCCCVVKDSQYWAFRHDSARCSMSYHGVSGIPRDAPGSRVGCCGTVGRGTSHGISRDAAGCCGTLRGMSQNRGKSHGTPRDDAGCRVIPRGMPRDPGIPCGIPQLLTLSQVGFRGIPRDAGGITWDLKRDLAGCRGIPREFTRSLPRELSMRTRYVAGSHGNPHADYRGNSPREPMRSGGMSCG